MNQDLHALYQLHLVDDQIQRARTGLASLLQPPELQRKLKQVVDELARYEAALTQSKIAVRDAELRLKTLEARREEDTKKLYSGKIVGTRELNALEHEIEGLTGSISETESAVLVAMEKVDPLEASVDKLRNYRKAAEEKLASIHEERSRERGVLEAAIATSEPRRSKAAAAVKPELLRVYEQVRRVKGHPGMAILSGTSCGCCHTSVPSMSLRVLREGSDLIQCDHCRRIFYIPLKADEASTSDDAEAP